MRNLKNIKFNIFFLLLMPFAIYLYFGIHHLTDFETADEHFWIYNPNQGRIHEYWDSIKNKNWLGTRINDKPGITLAYISGIGLFFDSENVDRFYQTEEGYRISDPEINKKLNFVFRLPILIFNGLFRLFIIYWLLKKLTGNKWLSVIATALMLLNPIILGISQIVNPDSLLWTFSTATFLSFLIYLKNEEKKFAILTSVFLGLSLLTKYTAIIFIPFFILVIILDTIYNFEKIKHPKELKERIFKMILSFILIILGAFLLFSILMPAVFLDSKNLTESTFNFRKAKLVGPVIYLASFFLGLLISDALFWKSKGLYYITKKIQPLKTFLPRILFFSFALVFLIALVNWSLGNNIFDISKISYDVGRSSKFSRFPLVDKILLETKPIVYSLTPLVLFFLMALWIKGLVKKLKFEYLAFIILSFIASFYFAVITQKLLVHIRYSIILYPLFAILAAISIYEIFRFEKLKTWAKFSIFSGVVFLGTASIYSIKPFYFNYTNFLLPKNDIITGAWGYGGYEAAQYLNSLPEAKDLIVWTDYHGFCQFFIGKCFKPPVTKKGVDEKGIPDYFVATRRGSLSNRKLSSKMAETKTSNPAWELLIDGREKNYIRIYKSIIPEEEYESEEEEKGVESQEK